MKSQVLHTVWRNISAKAAGEIWYSSLLGVKGLQIYLGGGGGRAVSPIKKQEFCYVIPQNRECWNVSFHAESEWHDHESGVEMPVNTYWGVSTHEPVQVRPIRKELLQRDSWECRHNCVMYKVWNETGLNGFTFLTALYLLLWCWCWYKSTNLK